MKFALGLCLGSLALFAGCHHSRTRSGADHLGEVSMNARKHKGELLASFGPVSSISHSRGSTSFKMTTVNYAYAFVVTYKGDVPGLAQGKDAHFLGRVTGSIKSQVGYEGRAITVEAIAVRPQGGQAVYRVREEELATQWIEGHLDMKTAQEEYGTPRSTVMQDDEAPRRTRRQREEPVAEAPADLPERPAAMQAYAPPAPAMVAPVAARGADAADLNLISSRWNALPEDVRAGILAQIKSVSHYSDLSIISQNWTSLPGDVKARILKQVIEGSAQ